MKKLKLVVADIDNTIIAKYSKLTEEAKDCITRLHKHGVMVGIASGRDIAEVKAIVSSWNCEEFDLLIGYNGGAIWDALDQKEESFYTLNKDTVKEIFQLMKPFDVNPMMYVNGNVLCGFYNDDMERIAKFGIMKIVVADREEEFYRDIPKVMFRMDPSIMPELETYLNEHKSEHFAFFKTQAGLMEFCDKRVHKAYALERFCTRHGIDLENVVAFGDTTNDNTMLQTSGLGVCMLNGSDDTKEIADVLTEKTCNENGWAYFVEKNILEPQGW